MANNFKVWAEDNDKLLSPGEFEAASKVGFKAGSNVTLTESSDVVTIAATNTGHLNIRCNAIEKIIVAKGNTTKISIGSIFIFLS